MCAKRRRASRRPDNRYQRCFMAEVTNELIYEVLKGTQPRLANIETGIVEVKTELQAVRGHLLAIQTDVANLYAGQANVEVRLSRIERRLELTDAPAQ